MSRLQALSVALAVSAVLFASAWGQADVFDVPPSPAHECVSNVLFDALSNDVDACKSSLNSCQEVRNAERRKLVDKDTSTIVAVFKSTVTSPHHPAAKVASLGSDLDSTKASLAAVMDSLASSEHALATLRTASRREVSQATSRLSGCLADQQEGAAEAAAQRSVLEASHARLLGVERDRAEACAAARVEGERRRLEVAEQLAVVRGEKRGMGEDLAEQKVRAEACAQTTPRLQEASERLSACGASLEAARERAQSLEQEAQIRAACEASRAAWEREAGLRLTQAERAEGDAAQAWAFARELKAGLDASRELERLSRDREEEWLPFWLRRRAFHAGERLERWLEAGRRALSRFHAARTVPALRGAGRLSHAAAKHADEALIQPLSRALEAASRRSLPQRLRASELAFFAQALRARYRSALRRAQAGARRRALGVHDAAVEGMVRLANKSSLLSRAVTREAASVGVQAAAAMAAVVILHALLSALCRAALHFLRPGRVVFHPLNDAARSSLHQALQQHAFSSPELLLEALDSPRELPEGATSAADKRRRTLRLCRLKSVGGAALSCAVLLAEPGKVSRETEGSCGGAAEQAALEALVREAGLETMFVPGPGRRSFGAARCRQREAALRLLGAVCLDGGGVGAVRRIVALDDGGRE